MTQTAIAITGASGYIGSSLATRLANDGFKVICLVRKNSNLKILEQVKNKVVFFNGIDSIADLAQVFKEQGVKTVMHLASCFIAEHESGDVEKLINSNILFGSKLLEAMDLANVKNLINTGTSWQHFNGYDYDPVCLYAATKEAFEKLITFYVNARQLKCITLKLTDTYGPNDPRQKIVPLLEKLAHSNEPIDMSGGEQELDLVHINDVIDAYLIAYLMLEKDANDPCGFMKSYMLSSGQHKPLREVVRCFEHEKGIALNINWGARPYRKREVMKVFNKNDFLPGWMPKYIFPCGPQ